MDKIQWSVPRSLDEPPRLLSLNLYHLMLILGFASLGIMAGQMFIGTLLGMLLARAYSSVANSRHPKFVMHLAHWYLPSWVLKMRQAPAGHLRIFVG